MRVVVFVLPYFGENSRRYLRALGAVEGVVLALIHQGDLGALPVAEQRLVTAAEQVGDALDEEAVAQAAARLAARLGRVDRVVGMIEQTQMAVARAREVVDAPGLHTAQMQAFRDKDRMKAVLREAGLPVARSRRIDRIADLTAFVDEVGFPVVVKPLAGLGSRATVRVRNAEELGRIAGQMNPGPHNPWQAEEFVTGRENTFEAVTVDGRTAWWSGSRYRPGPLTVIENPWIQYVVYIPRVEDAPEHVAFVDTNAAALAAMGLEQGLTHMEWFERADGSTVISEVGARPPGVHLMPLMGYAHDIDMIARWAELMVWERFAPAPRTHAVGCAFFRGQGRGRRVVRVRGLEEAQRAVGEHVVAAKLPRAGQPRSSHYEGEGWAIVRHPDTAVVEHALGELIRRVRVDVA